ncbi:hypothetical protein [Alteribacillus sp. HJP-4]|uniref:hypothetical protein n=1 Tax=Alteribacillus sp. HJP-4 TaxID=2775394 RepID=UPI0035CCDCF4
MNKFFRQNNPFFKMGRRRNFFGAKRRGNRGRMGMFLSLLGVGAGAAWFGLSQGRTQNSQQMQNMLSGLQRNMPAAETAFSEEITPDTPNKENE